VEPLTGEVFRMPHETELWNTHVLFYRHRIFLHRHAAPFLTFRWSGSVPAVRKEKHMYFDAKEFGKRLHDVRTSRGITQEELAVRLGLASKQHVSRMENGERSCSIDLLIELSCLLHVSTDYLLMGSEPSKEEVKNDLLSIISELSTIAKKI
jgi:DNA-binding XRE family transcriptional regulator